MVKGTERFRRRMLKEIPEKVRAEVTNQIQRDAPKVVRLQKALNPLPGTIEVDWTMDEGASAGPMNTGSGDGVTATIYATARTDEYPGGFPAIAWWWEFGTNMRRQKTTRRSTGMIRAQPFFFPIWRSERKRVRANIKRAVKRGFKKS